MGRWLRLDAEANIGDAKAFEIEGTRLAVFRTDGGFRALADICSHEYALLSEGEIWDGQVYCPKHGSAFDLVTGEVRGLPATEAVKTYALRTEGGDLWVELP